MVEFYLLERKQEMMMLNNIGWKTKLNKVVSVIKNVMLIHKSIVSLP